ncbi:alpha/beta-hydrolase [Mollisia scopiformis]|uniref:Alpha/beta-hydrolase n=1 Tax=Mollisia scopiformis TaxID=149040 RepID=A0A194XC15_MOLSC|nr:alpha/beta-hydrolase [Mollisia scopiformis]KUJ17705.1 alpha/beta-hydrolase [Mollisia scopiformis]
MASLITHQPVKGLYAFSAILLNALKLPFWLLYYFPSSTRPHPQWSLRQAVASKVLRTLVHHISKIQIYTPLILTPKPKEKNFLITISPSSDPKTYTGICADKQITPEPVCGYWYPSAYDQTEDKGQKIVLHFHGGAFVVGDCRPSEMAFAASILTKHIGKTLMVSYRLSSNSNGRFPAALQDAVSAVHYLLDLGIPYSDIVISGDSAGGNLAISLLRYLSTSGDDEKAVFKGALLWSPWVDLAISMTPQILYESPHRFTDYIAPAFAIWGANAYCPKDGPLKMDSEWISPGPNPFRTRTPVWVQGNDQEILVEQIKEFEEGMRKIEGNRVGWHNEVVATHDILLLGNVSGFESEAERAAGKAREWLDEL